MDVSSLAYLRQNSLFSRLEVTANNVANADTSGFKAELSVYGKSTPLIGGNPNPSPNLRVAVDPSQGKLEATFRPLDVAIDGEGFFAAESPLGLRYTRDGAFAISAEGNLVTKDGYPVQGDGGAISFSPEDKQFKIGDNGEVYALTDTGQEIRGTIAVFKFDDLSSLEKVGNSNFKSSSQPIAAIVNEDFKIAQGMLEGSNVNSVLQLTELIQISRSVQQVAGIIKDQHELQRNSITRITSED